LTHCFIEYESVETNEDFISFKEKHKGRLRFEGKDPDDFSIDQPFATRYFFPVLNKKGVYKIGSSIVKYTMDNQIVILDGDLEKLNNIDKYSNHEKVVYMPKLKSTITYLKDAFTNDNRSQTPGSVWFTEGKRRLRHELRMDNYLYGSPLRSGSRTVLHQRGNKKNWRGKWKNYRTVYGVRNLSIKIGNLPTMAKWTYTPHYTGKVYSATYELAGAHTVGTSIWYYHNPTIIFSCESYSRGVGTWYNLDH
jgi:hypothetical protein